MNDTVAFIHRLAATMPQISDLLSEHVTEYGELLPHVFMGELSRFVVEHHRGGAPGSDPDNCAVLRALFSAIERAAPDAPEDVQELVSVSFLENIAADLAASSALRALLGPTLRRELEPILKEYGYEQ